MVVVVVPAVVIPLLLLYNLREVNSFVSVGLNKKKDFCFSKTHDTKRRTTPSLFSVPNDNEGTNRAVVSTSSKDRDDVVKCNDALEKKEGELEDLDVSSRTASNASVDWRQRRRPTTGIRQRGLSPGQSRRRSLSQSQRSGGDPRASASVAARTRIRFDPIQLTRAQTPNHNAVPYHLNKEGRDTFENAVSIKDESQSGTSISDDGNKSHFELLSLDDLFPGTNFSNVFDQSLTFREELRREIRHLIFNSNPSYTKLPEKARQMLLSDGSSVEGSWFSDGYSANNKDFSTLTDVLKRHLSNDIVAPPTGEQLISTIGKLCGGTEREERGDSDNISSNPMTSSPSGHFIDIIGRKDRVITHSWHQDTGRSGTSFNPLYTVLWGFPSTNEYEGTGVYSHMIPLYEPHLAHDDHPVNEPILFPSLSVDNIDKHIVKPLYKKNCEILRFKDTHFLHSAPDVTYRSSLMRFM